MDFKDWASRQTGKAGAQRHAPKQQPQAAYVPPPAPGALPPPPPGYAYVPNAQYGFVLVPIGAPTADPSYPHQPNPARLVPQPPRRTETTFSSCELVKPSANDPYATLMAGIPDLIADPGYDAMNGRPNPLTAETLRDDALYSQSMHQPAPRAFTSTAHKPAVKINPLAGS